MYMAWVPLAFLEGRGRHLTAEYGYSGGCCPPSADSTSGWGVLSTFGQFSQCGVRMFLVILNTLYFNFYYKLGGGGASSPPRMPTAHGLAMES